MKNEQGTSRRTFLTTTAFAAAAGILGIGRDARASQETTDEQKKPAAPLIERTLGRTGIRVPIVGMGVMNCYNAALIRRAYELGIRHFDTAAEYARGQNEEMLGKMITELKARDSVTIATKVFYGDRRKKPSSSELKAYYLKSCEESLRRLKMDQVDILYSHSIEDSEWLNNPGILEALQELKAKKKTRFIGFTTHANFNAMVGEATGSDIYDVILATFNYSLYNYPEYTATLKKAADKGIGLVAMKTQCQQPWYKEGNPKETQAFYEGEIVHSALLKWVLGHDFIGCAVPGYTAFSQIEEDIEAGRSLEFTEKEKKFLDDRHVTYGMNSVCRQCGECVPTCPHKTDIPTLIRSHMYAASYGNFAHARRTFDGIPAGRSISNCTQCGSCTARCVKTVDIGRRIEELKTMYA